MRMRKKKNCDARMERCSDIWIKEPEKYKGKWAERFGNDNPIHIEIGCGKGNFIVGMAKMYPDVNFIAIEKVEDVVKEGDWLKVKVMEVDKKTGKISLSHKDAIEEGEE